MRPVLVLYVIRRSLFKFATHSPPRDGGATAKALSRPNRQWSPEENREIRALDFPNRKPGIHQFAQEPHDSRVSKIAIVQEKSLGLGECHCLLGIVLHIL